MKLQLKEYRVVRMEINPNELQSGNDNLDLKIGQIYLNDTDYIFGIGFKVDMNNEEFSLNMEMRFFFETDEPITENFKNSTFPIVNAPAIAFPYVRSFISTITLQAGYNAVMLPSINFVEFAKRSGPEN